MGVIWTSRTRGVQPQNVTEAAFLGVRHPIALLNFALPLARADVVDSSHVLTPAIAANIGKAAGVLRNRPVRTLANSDASIGSIVTSNKTTTFNTLLAASGAGSILAVVRTASLAGYGSGNFSPYITYGTAATFYEHYPYTDGNVYMGPLSGTRWISAYTPPTSLANYHVEVVTHTSGAQRFYYNGSLAVSASNVETPSIGAIKLGFGGSGLTAVFAMWDYVLSPAQVRAYSQNPWQLFAPERRPVFYSLPAPSGTSSAVVWGERARSRQPQALVRPAGSFRTGLYSLRALTGPTAANSLSGGRGTPSSGVSSVVRNGLRGVAFAATSDAISLPAQETDTGGGNFSALFVGRVLTGAYRFAGSSLTGDTYTWGHSSTNLLFTLISVTDLNSSIVLVDGSLVAVLYSYVRGVGVTFTKCDLQTGFVEQETVSSSSVPNVNAVGAYIGCRNLDFGWSAPLFMEARWRKAVDNATARVLVRNPWQLFAPERRPVFYSVGSGANTYAATISETATASETAAAVASFLGSISETVAASETMIARAVFGSAISETATASETSASVVTFTTAVSETTTASETMAAALGAATFAADISETATASETASTLVSLQAAISEAATASDSISSLVAFISAVSETATASDSIAAQLANQTYAADISETATASDVIVATMPTTYSVSIIETISISDIAAAGVPSSDFWTQISTTQVAGWGQTDNTQSSGWTIIPTT